MKKILLILLMLASATHAQRARFSVERNKVESGQADNQVMGIWTFNQGYTETTGRGHDGAITGSGDTIVDGVYVSTDADRLMIDVYGGDYDLIPQGSVLTMTAWVEVVQLTVHTSPLHVTQGGNVHHRFVMYSTQDKMGFTMNTSGGVPTHYGTVTNPYVVGTKYFWAAVYNGAVLRTYDDGVSTGTTALTGAIDTRPSGTTFSIGSLGDSSTNDGAVEVDEVRWYNKALSADEILKLYQEGPHK
jgi:hypothetical protein